MVRAHSNATWAGQRLLWGQTSEPEGGWDAGKQVEKTRGSRVILRVDDGRYDRTLVQDFGTCSGLLEDVVNFVVIGFRAMPLSFAAWSGPVFLLGFCGSAAGEK